MNYICHIELNHVEPKIWRRFQFDPEITFAQLHTIIQIVMGWEDYHLYEFQAGRKTIGILDHENIGFKAGDELDARREQVSKHLNKSVKRCVYLYDFGDGWEHSIQIENILDSPASDQTNPLCLTGERNCPKEDIGGPWGHEQLLKALLHPDDPELEHLIEWLDEDYDPAYFSKEQVNALLRHQGDELIPESARQQSAKQKPVKLTKVALNKHLKGLSTEQLIELVKQCYDSSKEAQQFLAIKVIGEDAIDSLFQQCRKKIETDLRTYTNNGKVRLQEAKKAIAEFEKLSGSPKHTFELRLLYVETGVACLEYGDMYGQFYESMASMYGKLVEMINESESVESYFIYKKRLQNVVRDSQDTGWGFDEALYDLYHQIQWQ